MQGQRQILELNQATTIDGHGYQHRVVDSVGSCSENRSEAAQNGNTVDSRKLEPSREIGTRFELSGVRRK